MSKIDELIAALQKGADTTHDTWEQLTSDQTSRSGHTVQRVAAALENGVDPDVIALQMTKNSERNNPENPQSFNGDEIKAIGKVYAANVTRVALTKPQTRELIKLQGDTSGAPSGNGSEPEPSY
ncbi:hypothetical protein [Pantoea piersonii]|uniref:hypothetical protein n=1 Tax=Pantoea TaxID=53335 RepID=UPI0028B0F3C1|nr:hypothetical protein [Pantoea piersonii]